MAKKSTPISIARKNLKTGFSSPAAKIGSIAAVVAIIGVGGIGFNMLQSKGNSPDSIGSADAGGYITNDAKVEGEIDNAETLAVIESQMNAQSEEALANGKSNLGVFAFETTKVRETNLDRDYDPGLTAEDVSAANVKADEVIANLRQRAASLDRIDAVNSGYSTSSRANAPAQQVSAGSSYAGAQPQPMHAQSAYYVDAGLNSSMVDAQGRPIPYGVTPEDFTQIATQLASVGRGSISYVSAPNGLLTAQQQGSVGGSNGANVQRASQPATSGSAGAAMDNVVRASGNVAQGAGSGAKTRLLAEAGAICPIKSESAINTDYPLPAFFEILSCQELTGVRLRGNIQQTPDNFIITFTDFFTTNKHKFKFEGQPQGVSVNINNEGYAGVASNVNNHWLSRIGSAALLNLANTEKDFLNQRGTSTITTGTSSTVAVEPMSEEDKNNARIAGVLQGTMDVITKDTQYGVNRKATMTMPAGTVIGVQFMTNIEVSDAQ